MGFELTVYVVRVTQANWSYDEYLRRYWAENIAMLELGKPGYSSAMYKLYQDAPHNPSKIPTYIFASDGDTKLYYDAYGVEFVAIPVLDVRDAVGDDICADNDPYWRLPVLHSLLNSIREGAENSDEIYCILRGH